MGVLSHIRPTAPFLYPSINLFYSLMNFKLSDFFLFVTSTFYPEIKFLNALPAYTL